jgi:RND family efflux transporter MFP subunit
MTVTAGCASSGGSESADQAEGAADANGARVLNVEVAPVVVTRFVDYIRLTGEAEALHDVTVSAEEAGRVARFAVRKGARVAEGQVIAKIDDAVLAAQVDETRAAADVAREQYERQQRLWEEDRIGSEIALLQLRSASDAAAARLRVLEERLARTEIRAPVAGVLDDEYVEVGEMVAPGTPVVRIVAVRQVKIVGGVPERFALDVQPGDSAVVTLDALGDQEYRGRIRYVGASVDPQNRTIPIEILLDNANRLVKPRMVADVQVARRALDDVVVVAQDLVRRTVDGYEVFVVGQVDGRDRAVSRPVTLGASYANRVVIVDGLEAGERLITVGAGLVDDGSFIRIVGAGEGGA